MTRMMESLECREMFSVAPADPTVLPAETGAPTEVVVVEKTTTATTLARHCCTGQHFPSVKL